MKIDPQEVMTMVRTDATQAAECLDVVEPILSRLRSEVAPDLSWEVAGADFDLVSLDLVRNEKRTRVSVTFEAWTNGSTDPSDLESALRDVVGKIGGKGVAYVITSTGMVERARSTNREELLDDVASLEADAETERLRNALTNAQD